MILDGILLSKINIIGKKLLSKSKLDDYPSNIDEMNQFLISLKQSIDDNKFEGILLANILFSFVSAKGIRNRKTTSRIFEDIFSSLFNQTSTDTKSRSNPVCIPEIKALDSLCIHENWKISSDLAGNKREKADLKIGNYGISLKTLKGPIIGKNNKIINNDINKELNVGSLSYRALLKGILPDNELKTLSDRKKGLGSGRQLRKFVFNPILKYSKKNEFKNRLKLFLEYVYDEDIYIVLKSHFRIDFILIPNSSFINSLIYTYQYNESIFQTVFYRWENNNLRLNWPNMLKAMNKFKLPYYKISMNLESSFYNSDLINFKNKIDKLVEEYIKFYID